MVVIGIPEKPMELNIPNLIFARRSVAGTLIAGLQKPRNARFLR